MKKIKKYIITLSVLLVLVFTVGGIANAVLSNRNVGDSNEDGEFDVRDLIRMKRAIEMSKTELERQLEGKYVSILGDSLSTYEGVSNSGSPNTTTAGYSPYYGASENELTDWTETYWGQIITKYDMKLLVNNSCGGNRLVDTSGTGVSAPAGYLRAGELAANTGDLNGKVPDVIFMHMGTNDYIGKVDRQRFKTAYETSLDTINEKYPNAQVYCFTLTPSHCNPDYDMLAEFNQVIREVVSSYDNVTLVDVAKESSIPVDNYESDYTYDGTHYNAAGISQVVTVLEKALAERNCN